MVVRMRRSWVGAAFIASREAVGEETAFTQPACHQYRPEAYNTIRLQRLSYCTNSSSAKLFLLQLAEMATTPMVYKTVKVGAWIEQVVRNGLDIERLEQFNEFNWGDAAEDDRFLLLQSVQFCHLQFDHISKDAKRRKAEVRTSDIDIAVGATRCSLQRIGFNPGNYLSPNTIPKVVIRTDYAEEDDELLAQAQKSQKWVRAATDVAKIDSARQSRGKIRCKANPPTQQRSKRRIPRGSGPVSANGETSDTNSLVEESSEDVRPAQGLRIEDTDMDESSDATDDANDRSQVKRRDKGKARSPEASGRSQVPSRLRDKRHIVGQQGFSTRCGAILNVKLSAKTIVTMLGPQSILRDEKRVREQRYWKSNASHRRKQWFDPEKIEIKDIAWRWTEKTDPRTGKSLVYPLETPTLLKIVIHGDKRFEENGDHPSASEWGAVSVIRSHCSDAGNLRGPWAATSHFDQKYEAIATHYLFKTLKGLEKSGLSISSILHE